MPISKFVSYLRVSTLKQGAAGLGIAAQRAAVDGYINGGYHHLVSEYVEVESGKNDARPELAAALLKCRLTGAVLIIARLDRLSRDAHFLLGLQKSGVAFIAADMPAANQLTIGILAVVAQAEREAISSRTKGALAAAKARGVILGGWKGGPKVNPATGRAAYAASADAFARDVAPTIQALRAAGLSLRQTAARLTLDGVKTSQGGAWSATAVKNVLGRL